jgi:HNH endonuclease
MSRREFNKAIKVEIINRASRGLIATMSRDQYCEKCHQPTKGRFEIHHLREDALEVGKSKPLTAEDGALWCKPCHDEHTRKFSTPAAALAKRQEAAHAGADSPNKQSIPTKPKPAKTTFKQDQIRALREARFR